MKYELFWFGWICFKRAKLIRAKVTLVLIRHPRLHIWMKDLMKRYPYSDGKYGGWVRLIMVK